MTLKKITHVVVIPSRAAASRWRRDVDEVSGIVVIGVLLITEGEVSGAWFESKIVEELSGAWVVESGCEVDVLKRQSNENGLLCEAVL